MAQVNKGDGIIQIHLLKHLYPMELSVSPVDVEAPDPLSNLSDMEIPDMETLAGSNNPPPVAHSELNDTIICISSGCGKLEDERKRLHATNAMSLFHFKYVGLPTNVTRMVTILWSFSIR